MVESLLFIGYGAETGKKNPGARAGQKRTGFANKSNALSTCTMYISVAIFLLGFQCIFFFFSLPICASKHIYVKN